MKPTPEMIDIGCACFGVNFKHGSRDIVERVYETMDKLRPPIPMVLYCPVCGVQHIDAPEMPTKGDFTYVERDGVRYPTSNGVEPRVTPLWTNPPHRSHLCAGCGYVWRPADMCTTGVASIETKGSADSASIAAWLASPEGKRKIAESLARSKASRDELAAAMIVPPEELEKSYFGCEVPGCMAHPRYGDAIHRTSPTGGPFAGRCGKHMSWTPPAPPDSIETSEDMARPYVPPVRSLDEIIAASPNVVESLRCDWCDGTGRGGMVTVCPKCSGAGMVKP